MTTLLFVLLSIMAGAQTVQQEPTFGSTIETDRKGTTYKIELAPNCRFYLDAEWTKSKPDISLHFKDVCTEQRSDEKTLAAYDKLLATFRASHEASLVKSAGSSHFNRWTERMVEIYLKEPVARKEAPSYKRYAELFNQNSVGREWTELLKKHGITVRLNSIEKMFRSKPSEVPLENKPPALLKRKASIPWGAGIYWFTAT